MNSEWKYFEDKNLNESFVCGSFSRTRQLELISSGLFLVRYFFNIL